MSDPTIPPLALVNDHSSMGIDNDDTYGVHIQIETTNDWIYTPEGRSPDYDAQILISIVVGTDANALCSSDAAADISFTLAEGESISDGNYDAQTNTYSWTATVTPQPNGVVISETKPLVFDMIAIKPNNVSGEAAISLLPRLKARPGKNKTDIEGTLMSYMVEKSTPPVVIDDVVWSLANLPGPGSLKWTATGTVQYCTIQANGEDIGVARYYSKDSQYEASNLILQSGLQTVTITACDQNGNTATNNTRITLRDLNPYFRLQVANGLPISLIASDQSSRIYGIFRTDQSPAEIWQNDQSGTQDNWVKTGLILKSGYETSPCVYYDSQFYLVGGSSFDFNSFQNSFWFYEQDNWKPIASPPSWNEPRIGQAVTIFRQAIWVAGGYGASGKVYDDVYSYNQGKWTPQPTLPLSLCNASFAVVGEKLYLFGGYSDMPGGTTTSSLYCLGESWVDQQKSTPAGTADYWSLGSLGGGLLLLASFNGTAFTGEINNDLPAWSSTTTRLSDLTAKFFLETRPPYGFSTLTYHNYLFLILTGTDKDSVFAYYDPSTAS